MHPIVELLGQLLGWQADDSLAVKRDKLANTLNRFDLARPATTWLLSLLLGLPTDTPAPESITAEQRARMREVFVALMQKRAAEQPLLLVIEDLHWSDPSTVDWLGQSFASLAAGSCLMLLTARPSFVPTWPPQSQLTPLTLRPLNPLETEQMLSALTGDRSLRDSVRQRIINQTDGIPLFIEELTRSVLESDRQPLEISGPSKVLPPIPSTLRDSLMARLDHAGAAKETAQWAACLGREFAYPVLCASVPYSEERLRNDLGSLLEADLIYQHDRVTEIYSFKHALLQETAQLSLLAQTRRTYHQRIAETLATRFPQTADTQPEVIARHYASAGQPTQAVDYWLRAGERATAQGAALEAKTFFENALGLIDLQDPARRWRALRGHEKVLDLQGERAAQQVDITALRNLAEELDNRAWRAEAEVCQLQYLNAIGDYPAMLPLADEVIQTARVVERPGLEAHALCLKAAALTRLGDPAAPQTAEAAVACGHAAADEWAIAYASGMVALHEAYAGDYARAAQLWTEVFDMVRRGGDRTLESRALSNLGAAYQYLGQYDQAQAYLEQGIALCDLIGDRRSHAYNVVNLGGVMLLSGDLHSAKKLFEQGLSEAIAVGDDSLRAGIRWELGRLAELSGDYAGATHYLEEALQTYVDMEMSARSMETTALVAKCALGQGQVDAARRDANQVWAYLQEHGSAAMDEALLTYLSLADVFQTLAESAQTSGDTSTVRAIIEAAYELVMARARKISDPAWRQSFLENVPSNRAVVERWQQLAA